MKRLLFIGLGLACNLSALAQVLDRQDQVTTFSSRIQTPVEVEVTRTKEELTFTAKNKSPYPYELELEFNVFRNLSPSMSKHTAILHSGSNRLFKLRIEDPEASPDYSYSIRYKIANSRSDIDLSFPYLIPLKPKAVVEPHTWSNSDGSDYYAINSFKGYSSIKGVSVQHPLEVVQLELSNKEKTKLNKKTLYSSKD